ncbi:hypothetical protein LTR49_027637 [Elasticomyces elasticus]|nr:hypothetical protein LTR49_027637 [Elasticomyces elasticus]
MAFAENLEMIREMEKVLNMIGDKPNSVKKEFTSAKEVAIKAEMKVKGFADLDQKWDSEESEGSLGSDIVGDEERSGMTLMDNPGGGLSVGCSADSFTEFQTFCYLLVDNSQLVLGLRRIQRGEFRLSQPFQSVFRPDRDFWMSIVFNGYSVPFGTCLRCLNSDSGSSDNWLKWYLDTLNTEHRATADRFPSSSCSLHYKKSSNPT